MGLEIIDVDRENREASSPDPINVFDIVPGTPRLVSENSEKVHGFDLNSKVTSPGNSRGMASRLPQDGPATKSLEHRLMTGRTRSSSPIEQFEDDPSQESSAQGRVMGMVSQLENATKQKTPHLDLRLKLKQNMKPKVSTARS